MGGGVGGCAVEVKGLGKYKNCLLGVALKQTYITLLIINFFILKFESPFESFFKITFSDLHVFQYR